MHRFPKILGVVILLITLGGLLSVVSANQDESTKVGDSGLSLSGFVNLPLSKSDIHIGQWARYREKTEASSDKSNPRVITIGVLSSGEPNARVWLEIQTTLKEGSKAAWRALIHMNGSSEVEQFQLKIGEHPTVEIGNPPEEKDQSGHFSKLIGEETVTTPAGTFVCRHVKVKIGESESRDIWLSAKAPFGGLVKLVENGTAVELVETGDSGFRTRFTDEEVIDLQQKQGTQEKD